MEIVFFLILKWLDVKMPVILDANVSFVDSNRPPLLLCRRSVSDPRWHACV